MAMCRRRVNIIKGQRPFLGFLCVSSCHNGSCDDSALATGSGAFVAVTKTAFSIHNCFHSPSGWVSCKTNSPHATYSDNYIVGGEHLSHSQFYHSATLLPTQLVYVST